ncbi:MAG: corrinoid protein [Anaerolineales bacterium]
MEERLTEIQESVIEGERAAVQAAVQAALDAGMPAEQILKEGLIAAMATVGRLFEEGEYFVPEMLIAAQAMKSGLALLKPHLVAADVEPSGRVVAGTVQGDLHDIGKNLVCLMLEGAGFEILDLGTDVSPEQFVRAVQTDEADVVALSALLTTTMIKMQATIAALEEAGLRERVKVIVGGAPVTQAYAERIGADGYATDAGQAVRLAQSLVE